MRTITCPHCGFSRDVPREAIPEGAKAVNCPACGERFPFVEQAAPPPSADPETRQPPGAAEMPPETAPERTAAREMEEDETIVCPVCSTRQEPTENCANCGLIFTKWEEVRSEGEDFYLADTGELLRSENDQEDALDVLPRAGFWQRLTAALIDLTIVAFAQLLFGALLAGVATLVSLGAQFGPGGWQTLMMPVKLFNLALLFAYFIVFTGYDGQTPGKMLMRIKVIREDDGEIGYARAFLREAPGKLISTLTFGLGFIMIGFQQDKRGLHDLLSGSSVVKLR
ncbi:MAG: hypothetical protein GWO11_08660 [Desulfuromonadales bacterium]|nr:hypothetical protein [Desulfuromonadales bacterium]NIR34366.1 hypothetical protein [Desulfuromonadales bacterium]